MGGSARCDCGHDGSMEQNAAAAMDDNAVESFVRDAVDYVIPAVELIGAAVVVAGAALAIWMFCASAVRLRHHSYEEIRLTLGRHLALGLEFQLGADILSTAVSPTLDDLARLGAIAAIRTVLNIFLQRELREEDVRVREQRATATDGPATAGRSARG